MPPAYTYIIRPPQSGEEWDEVRRLLLEYRKEFDDPTCFTSFEEEIQNIEGYYSEPGRYKLIVIEAPGHKIVGCVGMRMIEPGVAEMKRMYVIPTHRGLHLGKKLAVEIIEVATRLKYQKMRLDTMHEMEAAQHLYQALGFVIIAPYDHQDPSKVVCYEKVLN